MNARMLNSWLLGGEQVGYNFWKELYGQYNLVPFLGGNTGIQMAGWSNRLIEKVEDLKGLKVRVPGYGGRTLAAFEGEQVLVLPENICSGLTDGTINFAEWIGPYQDYKANMHKVAKYYYTPGWHEPSGQLEFFCNKTKYDYLPEDLQTIIDTAALRVQNWMLAEFDSRNLDYLSIIEDSGVKLKSFPKPLLKALKEVATDLIKKATEKDPLAARIYESYMGFMAEHNTWEETVDREFYGDVMSAEL